MPPQNEETATILVVDDDELIISSLRGLFALETGYEVVAKLEPAAAIEELERRPVDLIISDFLMPEINGVELLKKARALQPETIRILLTGFADKENAIRAINEAGLYHYLEKPWDNDLLLNLVRNGLQQKSLRQQLTEKVEEFERLMSDHSQLSDRHRSIERELEMAARVQRNLLPTELPSGAGFVYAGFYRASTHLGGDFYDVAVAGDSNVILLADVSGHGVQAALTSMLLKAIFHESVGANSSPVELLGRMNVLLHRFLPGGMYSCATAAWVEPADGRIRIANAGMPHPFVLRAAEKRVDQIAINGLPLGLFGHGGPASYDSREIELARGDVLLMLSDGITEARVADGRELADAGLVDILAEFAGLPGAEVVAGLLKRAESLSTKGHFDDDVSMVAVTKI